MASPKMIGIAQWECLVPTGNTYRYSYCMNNPLQYYDLSGWNYVDIMMDNYAYDGGGFWYRGGYMSYGDGGWSYYTPSLNSSDGGYRRSALPAGMSTDYHYNYSTNTYHNANGESVPYDEVYNNYVIPNAITATTKEDISYILSKGLSSIEIRNGIEGMWVQRSNWDLMKREGDIGSSSFIESTPGELILAFLAFPNAQSTGGFDIEKAVSELNKNALSESIGKCAKYIRYALEAGGINTAGHPVPAAGYDSFLLEKGFETVNHKDYIPIKGDIVVMESFMGVTNHPDGHIQMYNGTQWISDFRQNGFWPGSDYRNYTPYFTILRW